MRDEVPPEEIHLICKLLRRPRTIEDEVRDRSPLLVRCLRGNPRERGISRHGTRLNESVETNILRGSDRDDHVEVAPLSRFH